ncbi:rotatin homolog anastral spindle 3 isoform X2 [Leptinotarsa decemlineata]|uniref:rotatin homolog anastral spindle 3 isoform X2 n=1 Tax=Leptinotarsa decemlineata TaxID=7539 RepID=UPI003D3074D0
MHPGRYGFPITQACPEGSGKTLINHLGKSYFMKELDQIRSYLEPEYYTKLDEITRLIEQQSTETIVPPLECDVPLSYRTVSSTNVSSVVGTTASVIEGYIQKSSSVQQQAGVDERGDAKSCVGDSLTYRVEDTTSFNLPNFFFEWQPLIETDRHVLHSVEKSLTNPPQPSSLLHSCEFFTNVLLHDFPAEIFLQRPTIILEFHALMQCGSTRITNAVLECFCNLTSMLQRRIHHQNDLTMRNRKLGQLARFSSIPNTPVSGTNRTLKDDIMSEIRAEFEMPEEISALERNQLSTTKYCFITVNAIFKYLCIKEDILREKVKSNQVAVNLSLSLLNKLTDLLSLCIRKAIWDETQNERTLSVLKNLNEMLVKYGMALEHFRLESVTFESNLNYRVIYIYLLHSCVNLLKKIVPISKTDLILPRNLKSALANSLLDVTFSRLYPHAHNFILDYVQSFSIDKDTDLLKKYIDVQNVCQGMTSTVKFLKQHKTLPCSEILSLAVESLPSLEFHKEFDFLKILVDTLSDSLHQFSEDSVKLASAEDIILSLLAHSAVDIREETYRLCQKKVLTNIGPKLSTSPIGVAGSQILFLLSSKILTEVAAFGMTSDNIEIKRYAEDMIIYILKCKILVCEAIWNKVIQTLIPSLPIIACHASKNSALGKTVMNLMDPDTSRDSLIPPIVMLKCNIQLLFTDDAYLREEAFSRVCWLLSSQENSREMLPKVNTLYDTSLAGVCRLKKVVDINKMRRTEHFYQPSSLHQVLEVLKSPNIEPVIRRSALNQISVMMEDPLLHQILLDANGIGILNEMMKSALTESDYRNYPDSIIPIVSIFKNICFYHGNVREELSLDTDVIYCILRGLFLYFAEERMKQDATSLLVMLIFKDFILGNPSRANFSMPNLVIDRMHLPFICSSHWIASEYSKENLKDTIISDRWCLSSIQIQWNAEFFGGFENLVKRNDITCDDHSMCDFADILKLNDNDLKAIKASSIDYCVKYYSDAIQNATSHSSVVQSIDQLILYVFLYKLVTNIGNEGDTLSLLNHPWEQTFVRFLKSLPACEEDAMLLKKVIQFLCELACLYKTTASGKDGWISSMLKDETQSILDLLSIDSTTDEMSKAIGQELLKLITTCVRQEQHYIDYQSPPFTVNSKPWTFVIKTIAENLSFSDSQHFYNLAYLDSLLSCLVHLTASLGWSDCKPNSNVKEPLPQMIAGLCGLIGAFHSGKGPTAAISVMGLSITRHALLVLNHLIAELQYAKVKGWETYFFENISNGNSLHNLIGLWPSRDVIIRAAALQLFSGLAVSPRAAVEIVTGVKIDDTTIWDLAFTVLIDHDEASIVRENAAQFLANLAGHSAPMDSEKSVGTSMHTLKKSYTMSLLNLIEEYDFYNNSEILLCNLFTLNISEKVKCLQKNLFNKCLSDSEISRKSDTTDGENSIISTTPGLVKSLGNLLLNLLNLDSDTICRKMQEQGLVKLLFRLLFNPSMSIDNTRELSFYCDILEMNAVICSVLARVASIDSSILGTILHTRDCLNLMFSLLNPKVYHVDLPQLIYLRNQLWTEIYNLISTLIEYSSETKGCLSSRSLEVLSVFCDTLSELGIQQFLEALCESISCLGSHDLQTSALNALTCLLRIESHRLFEKGRISTEKFSLQILLDSVRSSRSIVMSDSRETVGRSKNNKYQNPRKDFDKYKMSLLEEAYFGKVFTVKNEEEVHEEIEISIIEDCDSALMSGAEICKILLYLYDICDLKVCDDSFNKKKPIVISALSGLLCISKEAKRFASGKGLVLLIVKQLRDCHIRLSLESVECLRRVADKRRVCPLLKEANDLIGLLTNFMLNDESVKTEAATLNLADIIHKLWTWFLVQNVYLVDVLKMICVYTTGCNLACQTLPLTSPVAGSGPRKCPGTVSLLNAIVTLINKEMEQISRTHDLALLQIAFNILNNVCHTLECRILISKSTLFQSISRLHPAITKRQKPWESIELIWLEFLQTFTTHPEGQASVTKITDVLELVMTLTTSSRTQNRQMAMSVLRNISFYQPNKARLLSSGDFLNILQNKLTSGSNEEKNITVVIIWALSANSQKAKIILRSLHLDDKLENIVKHCQLLGAGDFGWKNEDLDTMRYVLDMLRDKPR